MSPRLCSPHVQQGTVKEVSVEHIQQAKAVGLPTFAKLARAAIATGFDGKTQSCSPSESREKMCERGTGWHAGSEVREGLAHGAVTPYRRGEGTHGSAAAYNMLGTTLSKIILEAPAAMPQAPSYATSRLLEARWIMARGLDKNIYYGGR